MDYWIWALLLFTVGISLALLEVFFVSGGILGLLSASALIAAVVMGFMQGSIVGLLITLGIVVGLPAVVILALKYWPKTRMGKRVLLMAQDGDNMLPDDPEKQHLKELIGRVGHAKSKMLLSGVISIDGMTIDAVSESMPIEVGRPVRVISVRGASVVVRPVEEQASSPPANPLEQTFDDPFDLPPG